MGHPSDQTSTNVLNDEVAKHLVELHDDVLKSWEKMVREKIPLAENLSEPILIDTLPVFLANLAEALSPEHPRNLATDSNSVAQEHGGERARVTHYGPEQVIKEYQILRHVVFEKLASRCTLNVVQKSTIEKSFDEALQRAMMSFFLVQNRLRDQFIATLSHDLRNPLSAAKMAMDILLRDLVDPIHPRSAEDKIKIARRALHNIRKADNMIQNLLDSSAAQSGARLVLHLQPHDMLNIVESLASELNEEQRPLTKVIGDSAQGFWDSEFISRALENLISNAFKYGLEGSPVTVRVYSKLGRVMVSVHNDGDPIPTENREVLFQPFRRMHAARKSGKEGWGIGLAQVRSVAESHGGSLAVDSSLECGTTFTMDLPADGRPFQNSPVTEPMKEE